MCSAEFEVVGFRNLESLFSNLLLGLNTTHQLINVMHVSCYKPTYEETISLNVYHHQTPCVLNFTSKQIYISYKFQS